MALSAPSTKKRRSLKRGGVASRQTSALDGWRLIRCVGRGAVARVYAALPRDARSDAEPSYALKVLQRRWWNEPAALELMRREAQVGMQTKASGICPVFDAQLQQPPYYLVMPLLEGETLAERISRSGGQPLAETLWYVRQAAEGLSFLHNTIGVVHGDIKPSNLFVSSTGHLTLIDHGFARPAGESPVHWESAPLGTLAYTAPELLRSHLSASVRTDIYSLGITFFELLAGRRPYAEGDSAQLVEQKLNGRPDCIRDHLPDTPQPIAGLLHSMMAQRAENRPANYPELIDRLIRLEVAYFGWR